MEGVNLTVFAPEGMKILTGRPVRQDRQGRHAGPDNIMEGREVGGRCWGRRIEGKRTAQAVFPGRELSSSLARKAATEKACF
ncbi:MAG: hypothetical protein K5770_06025 [Lachnospiraceae bacterium]|nr:hypothetical protein [Lachnospiraceae bacterium]